MSARKVFALAFALAPVYGVACSATGGIAPPPPDAGLEGGEKRPPPKTKVDAGQQPFEDGGGALLCPNDEINAATFRWKPPSTAPGSCTEADLVAFVALVEKTDDPQKWKDGPWTANETCRDCVFAKETTTWAPLILNASGQLADLNVGGCIAIVSGNEACGRTYQQFRTCAVEACYDICGPNDPAECSRFASKKICKKAFETMVDSCGGYLELNRIEGACDGVKYIFEGPIRAQCIGLPDGGI